jgi:hypothetical protein
MSRTLSDEQKNYWDLVISIITIIGVLLGGALTFEQYVEAKTKDRVERTFEFLSRYNQTPLSDDNAALNAVWSRVLTATLDKIRRQDLKPGPAHDALVRNILDTIDAPASPVSPAKPDSGDAAKDTPIPEKISDMIEFYDQLAVCVDAGLCDEDLARTYFGTEAYGFFSNAYPFVCRERHTWNDPNYARQSALFAMGNGLDAACRPWTFGRP